ncbi:MAG: hypothetical protein OEZ68_02445 [Gammaproteobacteria bacterium]|nr:hypothetical protein [Gammaproteobacteria bacterium]MDH5799642.1 hypothetical protein [Gammaproteobacteria bacterium]
MSDTNANKVDPLFEIVFGDGEGESTKFWDLQEMEDWVTEQRLCWEWLNKAKRDMRALPSNV